MKSYTRRALSWVLAIALLISCGISGLVLPAAAEGEETSTNLIANGDFEGDTKPSWCAESRWVEGAGKDGTKGYVAEAVGPNQDKGSSMKPWLKLLQPETTYKLSFDYKHEGTGWSRLYTSRSSGTFNTAIGQYKVGDEWVAGDIILPGGDRDWDHYEVIFTTGVSISKQDDGLYWRAVTGDETGAEEVTKSYFDNLCLEVVENYEPVAAEDVVFGFDFEGEERPSWIAEKYAYRLVEGAGKNGTKGYVVDATGPSKDSGSSMKPWLKKLEPNTTYVLSFDYKHKGTGYSRLYVSRTIGTVHTAIGVGEGTSLQPGDEWKAGDIFLEGGDRDWEHYEISFTTGDSIAAQDDGLYWRQVNAAEAGAEETGYSYFDNIQLAKAKPAEPVYENLIENGDFEGEAKWGAARVLEGVGKDGTKGYVAEAEGANAAKGSSMKPFYKLLKPNTKYLLRFDYKHEGNGSLGWYIPRVFGTLDKPINGYEEGRAFVAKETFKPVPGGDVDWTTIDVYFTTGLTITAQDDGLFWQQVNGESDTGLGKTYIDNILLAELGEGPAVATAITLNKTEETLLVNRTLTLTATPDPAGTKLDTVKWTTSDANVATVDANGVVTAVAGGTATITATAGTLTATCTITVVATDGNLIQNGDFEEGSNEAWGNSAAVQQGIGRDGGWGVVLQTTVDETTREDQREGLYYALPLVEKLEKNAIYELSFDTKHSSKGYSRFQLDQAFGLYKNVPFRGEMGSVKPSSWTTYTFTFMTTDEDLTADAGKELRLLQYSSIDGLNYVGTGKAYFDNIKLVKIGETKYADSFTVAPAVQELLPGDSHTITVWASPADTTTGKLTFASADPSIATVDDRGTITAGKTEGETTITVTDAKGNKGEMKVVVTEFANVIKNGSFDQGNDVGWGKSVRVKEGIGKDGGWGLHLLNPTAGSESANYYKDPMFGLLEPNTKYIISFDYTTSTGASFRFYFPSLNYTGKKLAYETGDGTEWKHFEMEYTTPANITLDPGYDFGIVSTTQGTPPVVIDNFAVRKYNSGVQAESIEFNKTEVTLFAGRTASLKVTATPADADLNGMIWTSSNEDVATVESGFITAVGAGTAIITGTTKNGKSATCTVDVSGEPAVLKNGTFDVAGDTTSWVTEGGATIVEGVGRGGSKAGSLPATNAVLKQTVKGMAPNTIYTIQLYTLSKTAPASVVLKNGSTEIVSTTTKVGTDWALTTLEFKTPETMAEDTVVTITATDAGGIYVDNVLLSKKASLVDLVVTDLYWVGMDDKLITDHQALPGAKIRFGVTVVNQGTDPIEKGETVVVELRKNGTAFKTIEFKVQEAVGTGDNVLVAAEDDWVAEKGHWVISAYVNPKLQILEMVNTNNKLQKQLRVDEFLKAPDIALNAGMGELTFSDEFDSTATIDEGATGQDGYKWYVRRQWDAATITPEDYKVEDGIISLICKKPGYHVTLSTMDYITGIGYAYNKGYLEVRFQIPIADPGKSNVDYDGSPAIWSFPDTKWMETKGKNREWVEMDWMEYWGVTAARPGGYYTVSLHDQISNSEGKEDRHWSNTDCYLEGLGDEQWHVMSWLWVDGAIYTYIDGKETYRCTYSADAKPSCSLNLRENKTDNGKGAFAIMNEQFNVLYLSGSEKFPMLVDYVRIWQEGGTNPVLPDGSDDNNDDNNNNDNDNQGGTGNEGAVDVPAADFWWYFGADDYGDLIEEVTEENYEIILSGAELWKQLSAERQAEIDALFEANGQPKYSKLLEAAEKFAADLENGSDEGEGDGEEDKAPEAEKPAGTGATTALPVMLVVVMLACAAVLWTSRKREQA